MDDDKKMVTVLVSVETRRVLAKIKYEGNFKSYDEVIKHLTIREKEGEWLKRFVGIPEKGGAHQEKK